MGQPHTTGSNIDTSTWRWVPNADATGSGQTGEFFDALELDTLQHAPWSLYGALLPAAPHRHYLAGGVFLRGGAGIGWRGDRWQIAADSPYPAAHLFHPSPSRVYRSVDTRLQRIAVNPSGYDTHFGAPTWGFFVQGFNGKTVRLLAWNGSSWSTILILDMRGDWASLPFTRVGDTVFVDTGTAHTSVGFAGYHALVGGSVDFGSSKVRRIIAQTEGAWTDDDTKRPILLLSGIDGTEPASGTLDIWHTQGFGLIHNDLNAYDLVLRSEAIFYQDWTSLQVKELLEKALEIDPG